MFRNLLVLVVSVVLLSGCFIGRRGRTLAGAVEHEYPCADAQGFRHEETGPNRYRVHACWDGAKYRHVGVYHCSRRRCENLTVRAQQYFSFASSCPPSQIDVRETVDPSIFYAVGCAKSASLRCAMRDQVASCEPMQVFAIVAPPAAAPPAVAPTAPPPAQPAQ